MCRLFSLVEIEYKPMLRSHNNTVRNAAMQQMNSSLREGKWLIFGHSERNSFESAFPRPDKRLTSEVKGDSHDTYL